MPNALAGCSVLPAEEMIFLGVLQVSTLLRRSYPNTSLNPYSHNKPRSASLPVLVQVSVQISRITCRQRTSACSRPSKVVSAEIKRAFQLVPPLKVSCRTKNLQNLETKKELAWPGFQKRKDRDQPLKGNSVQLPDRIYFTWNRGIKES